MKVVRESRVKFQGKTHYLTETVFKGSENECLEWVQSTIDRNDYEFDVLTDLNMRPVWLCRSKFGSEKCFSLRGES